MAGTVLADEGTYIAANNIFKVFSRTGVDAQTIKSPVLNFGKKRRWILWKKISGSAGGTPVFTTTVNHVRPESPAPPTATDEVAHATTVAQTGDGIKRQEYGDQGATPVVMSNVELVCVVTTAGTAKIELWIEFLD